MLQLYRQEGRFWEAVQALRTRRGIKPSSQLPPERLLLPLSPPSLIEQKNNVQTEQERDEWNEANGLWRDDLLSIVLKVVPERFCARHSLTPARDWYGFVSACVLHHPEDDTLYKFSEIDGPPYASSLWMEDANDQRNAYSSTALPIRRMVDPVDIEHIETEYWATLLDKLEELYLRPLGHNLSDMLEDVHQKFPEIRRTRREKARHLKQRRYIEVDEYTYEEDVRAAFSKLAASHKTRPVTGRSKRDKVMCVEAAILHDRHGWTYQQLAYRYGWSNTTRASKYIKDGRGILKEQ